MLLLQLPFELQLLILDHIKQDNHLDLAPLAQTCSYYSNLVADRFNWTNTVTILQPSRLHSSSLNYLVNAFKKSQKLLQTKKLQIISDHSTTPFVINLLEKQQSTCIQDMNVMIPSAYHHKFYQTLIDFPQTNLQHITVRDPADDGYIMNPIEHHMLLSQFLSMILSKSQLSLKTLDLSSFPSNLLVSHSKKYQFPSVTILHIALVGCQDPDHFDGYWRQFKCMFPNLVDLRVTLSQQSLPLFKSLLQDITLFPWIKRLSTQSRESPKDYLTREELRECLLQLNGLNRVTAGWDMIALN